MIKSVVFYVMLIALPGYVVGCKDEIINFKEGVFYVATDGDDNNPGTFDKPWATWGKAFTSSAVNAGDTVFIRGGVYQITVTDGNGYYVTRTGNSNDWIVYSSYPGEVPVLDCSNADAGSGDYNIGVGAYTNAGANYIKFIGLTVRNVFQLHGDHEIDAAGFSCSNGFFTFEKCTAYNIDGHGFDSYFYYGWPAVNGKHYLINCDAYNCSNPYAFPPAVPGQAGVGFNSQNWYGTEGHSYAIGCRAWKCGDQGFSWNGDHYCEVDGCWSFNNGLLQGDGHGFKLGWITYNSDSLRHVVKNSIAAYNRQSGITTNDDGYPFVCKMNIFNNTIYHNGYYDNWPVYIYGFIIEKTSGSDTDELTRVYKNNISYGNEFGDILVENDALYTHVYNSWDNPPGATITNADFVSVDSTGITGQRQADGSLPNLNFLRLAKGSALIDAGINIGLPFRGKAPDLGAFERE